MNYTQNNQHRIAIIGFGKLGLLHTGVFNGLERSKVKYIVDNSSQMLSMLKSQMPSIHIFEDYKVLLDKYSSEIDAAVIATPSQTHGAIAKEFIQRKIPVLIEKPLTTTLADAETLYEESRKSGVASRVGYMSRFIETFANARKVVQSGALGKLQSLRCNMYISQLFKEGKGWRYSKSASGGGVLITQNSHLLDLLTWILGDIDWVSAHAKKLYSREVEDEMHAYLGFKSGLEGWIDSSWSIRHHRTLTMNIQIQGENGNLIVTDDDLSVFLDNPNQDLRSGWTYFKKPDLFKAVAFDVAGPQYTAQAEDFLNAVEGKNQNVSTGADILSSYKVQSLIDALYLSSEKRGQPTQPTILKWD